MAGVKNGGWWKFQIKEGVKNIPVVRKSQITAGVKNIALVMEIMNQSRSEKYCYSRISHKAGVLVNHVHGCNKVSLNQEKKIPIDSKLKTSKWIDYR